MMSKWHMGFAAQTNVETTLRKAILCASDQLHSNVSPSNSVTKSFHWLSVQIPFKKVAQVPELCTEFLANGIEVDKSKQSGIPIAEV